MYLQKYTILVTTILLQSVLLSKLHCQLPASRILSFAKTPRKEPQAKIPRGIFMPRGIFLEFNFCGCLYHAGLQCLLCCRSIWQGYPRMALGGGNRGIKGSLLPSTCLGSLLASKMCPCYGPLVKLWFAFLACCNRSTVWCHMPLNSRLMSLPFVHHAYTCTLGLPWMTARTDQRSKCPKSISKVHVLAMGIGFLCFRGAAA